MDSPQQQYARYVYLEKVRELRARVDTGKPHDIVMGAAILRHLLLEERPLLHQANKETKIKFTFRVQRPLGDFLPASLPRPTVFFTDIYPFEGLPEKLLGIVKEREFLALTPLTIQGQDFSILDIIKTAAHVMGGVHLSEPNEKESLLIGFNSFYFNNMPGALATLRSIILVVLEAIKPLTDALEEESKDKS